MNELVHTKCYAADYIILRCERSIKLTSKFFSSKSSVFLKMLKQTHKQRERYHMLHNLFMLHHSHSQVIMMGCWWPGAYLAPGHLQPSWWHTLVGSYGIANVIRFNWSKQLTTIYSTCEVYFKWWTVTSPDCNSSLFTFIKINVKNFL